MNWYAQMSEKVPQPILCFGQVYVHLLYLLFEVYWNNYNGLWNNSVCSYLRWESIDSLVFYC